MEALVLLLEKKGKNTSHVRRYISIFYIDTYIQIYVLNHKTVKRKEPQTKITHYFLHGVNQALRVSPFTSGHTAFFANANKFHAFNIVAIWRLKAQ